MAKRLRVGIVGGGIAGCAAALLLARDGHDVELLEQTPHIGPVGAGILVQPSGQRVLAEMNLLAAIDAKAARIEALIAWTHLGRQLSRLTYGDHTPGMCALGVHRADLFEAIHAASCEAGVRVRLGHSVDRSRLTRGARQLMCGDAIVGTYDLVIAADGSRSRLRMSSGLPAFTHAYTGAALWAVGRSETPVDQLVQYTRGNIDLCGLLPMGGGRCSFFWSVDTSDLSRLKAGSFEAWRGQVLELAPAAEGVLRSLTKWDDLMFASYRAVAMLRVTGDRLVFIGDAAHAAGPHLGQGANLAMLDAVGLRDALRADPLPRALDRYNASQRWRNAYYSLATAALMPTFQGSFAPLGPARDIALPLLQSVPPLRKLMLRTLCGVW
jgi:2-polyprenyl-6-methoxyphenol hydroxylase-like FAD-dependent oxidoreductase